MGNILVGDIGGTKTVLGVFDSLDPASPIALERFANAQFDSCQDMVMAFLKKAKVSHGFESSALGIAGPVDNADTTIKLTNLPWAIDLIGLKKAFSIERIRALNDIVALAWSIGSLQERSLTLIKPGEQRPGNAALICAGTGLGQATLFWNGKAHMPSPSEGGHSDFAPRNSVEVELLCHLIDAFGHVSYERVLSGQGLVNIFEFLRNKRKGGVSKHLEERLSSEPDRASIISDEALNGDDRTCKDALNLLVSIYGAEAGNLALKSFATSGVYIGGGIAPKILPALKSKAFADSFVKKGRFEPFLSKVPVWVINDENAAIYGALKAALDEGPFH